MNQFHCWYCNADFEYDGEKYCDVDCPHCGVLNSIYDPLKYIGDVNMDNNVTKNEEDEMINYNDEKYQGKYVYLPRIGEEITVEIKELREVKSDNPKFNFKENVPVLINGEPGIDDEGEPLYKQKDLGYHVEAEIEGGKILSITSISAFLYVFKKHNVQDGDKIYIEHPEKGIWKVTKL